MGSWPLAGDGTRRNRRVAVTAKVRELGVPPVTAFHVTRVILLLTCTGPLFARVRERKRRVAPRDAGGPVA